MPDIDIAPIEQRIEELERVKKIAQDRLAGSPKGRLTTRKIRGHERFYKTGSDGAHSYLPLSCREEIIALADKRYCESLLIAVNKELRALYHFVDAYKPSDKYLPAEKIPDSLRDTVRPIIISPQEKCRIWQAKPYRSNSYPFNPDSNYTSSRGETVRSRIEYIIADYIAAWPLAYHYEELLTICGHDIYPDFTIMHPVSCELYYLEFFGMLDNPDYAENAFKKIRLYQTAGLDSHAIFIFDSQAAPFQSSALPKIFETYFGPRPKKK